MTHLIILIHGVNGYAKDLRYIADAICKVSSKDITVVSPTVNQGYTHDGIFNAATRYLNWLEERLISHPETSSLSIIGHSLGGLTARCLAGLLLDRKIIPERIRPHTLMTLATPHMRPSQYDYLCGKRIPTLIMRALLGRSGLELAMKDSEQLLLKLADDDLYLSALSLFRPVTYSNLDYDVVVSFGNASLVDEAYVDDNNLDIRKARRIYENETLPFVFELEYSGGKARLSQLKWTRYVILPKRRLLAHADMVMIFDNRFGKKIVSHIAQQFSRPRATSTTSTSSTL